MPGVDTVLDSKPAQQLGMVTPVDGGHGKDAVLWLDRETQSTGIIDLVHKSTAKVTWVLVTFAVILYGTAIFDTN